MDKSRIPWGFVMGHNGKLVANTSQALIQHRALLGETAIRVLLALGISLEQLEALVEIDDPALLLTKLQEART
jgi:hypothetical protein